MGFIGELFVIAGILMLGVGAFILFILGIITVCAIFAWLLGGYDFDYDNS